MNFSLIRPPVRGSIATRTRFKLFTFQVSVAFYLLISVQVEVNSYFPVQEHVRCVQLFLSIRSVLFQGRINYQKHWKIPYIIIITAEAKPTAVTQLIGRNKMKSEKMFEA